MTTNQFHKLTDNFADYAHANVEFTCHIPTADNEVQMEGALKGIGKDANADHIIIAWCGSQKAIHYSNVKFPKA